MINFRELGDGTINAVQDQNDGSTRVIAKIDGSIHHPKKDPALYQSWEIVDDKMNSVAKIAVAQGIALAYTALGNVAVLRDLLRNHAETLAIKD